MAAINLSILDFKYRKHKENNRMFKNYKSIHTGF